MSDHQIQHKKAFQVLGIGTELSSPYQDQAGLMREKVAFWDSLDEDRFQALLALALNEQVFAVNEVFNGRMMHYAGVMAEAFNDVGDRLIHFPAGEYLVLAGPSGSTASAASTRWTSACWRWTATSPCCPTTISRPVSTNARRKRPSNRTWTEGPSLYEGITIFGEKPGLLAQRSGSLKRSTSPMDGKAIFPASKLWTISTMVSQTGV